MSKIKTCYICGNEFETLLHGANRKVCFEQTCIDEHKERQKETQKQAYKRYINKLNSRDRYGKYYKSTKMARRQKAKGNGWFCQYCGKELSGARRFHCRNCEKIVCRGEGAPRMEGDWAYV